MSKKNITISHDRLPSSIWKNHTPQQCRKTMPFPRAYRRLVDNNQHHPEGWCCDKSYRERPLLSTTRRHLRVVVLQLRHTAQLPFNSNPSNCLRVVVFNSNPSNCLRVVVLQRCCSDPRRDMLKRTREIRMFPGLCGAPALSGRSLSAYVPLRGESERERPREHRMSESFYNLNMGLNSNAAAPTQWHRVSRRTRDRCGSR